MIGALLLFKPADLGEDSPMSAEESHESKVRYGRGSGGGGRGGWTPSLMSLL